MHTKLSADELMGTFELIEKNSQRIQHTDADGNEFDLLSNGVQSAIARADIKTPVVCLPSCVSDESGTTHPLTCIGRHAFMRQQALKHLIIPDGVLYIEGGVFAHSGSILSVVIPASVQKIDDAFWNCPTFEENKGGKIYYTGSPEQWRALLVSYPLRGMMDYTPYNKVVQFIPNDTDFEIPDLDFQTCYDEDFEMEVSRLRVCELGGTVTIPEAYTDSDGTVRKIIHVGRSSFAGNRKIEKVIIPSGVQRICQDAFYGCENLREVVILKSDDALDIEIGAFFKCKNLEKVYIGRPCRWGEYALEGTNAQKIETD